MDENNMGQFIAELRKEKKLTQKELADQLHITDKAVSKWERNLSCPDITLLAPLAGILGVTAGELLNGRRSGEGGEEADAGEAVDQALAYGEKSVKSKVASLQSILALSFSLLALLGVVVCAICDVAISGGFTWSRLAISASIFGWLVLAPLVRYGGRGISWSLASLSVFILPFLYVIDRSLGGVALLMPIGIRTSLLSVAYLWGVYLLFRRLKARRRVAAALSLLLAVPLCLAVNGVVEGYVAEPSSGPWNLFACGVFALAATGLLAAEWFSKRKGQ